MENTSNNKFKLSYIQMCLIGFICPVLDAIQERLGTYPHYSGGRFAHNELLGITIPLILLIIPIFAKNLRVEFWKPKNLVIGIFTLAVSVILIAITYANKDYYRILWIESGHWERSDAPKIIWDFWNIIGKHA